MSLNRTKMVAFAQQIGLWQTSPTGNSMAMIERAWAKKFDAVELDVRVSSDGVAVLAHDDVLKGPSGEITVTETCVADLLNFQIGVFEDVPQYVVTLSTALVKAQEMNVLIDPRVKQDEYTIIRRAVENVGFDPAKLLFCAYGQRHARLINEVFPESVSLYKIARHFRDVSLAQLDEAAATAAHGVMLFRPIYDEDFSEFMAALRQRQLQVLFYVHGGWPKADKPDIPEDSLQNMIDNGVDYVTTVACDTPAFKALVGRDS